MGLLDFLKPKAKTFQDVPPSVIRDTLFGDRPFDYWASINSKGSPWSLFKDAKRSLDKGDKVRAIEILKEIISLPALESRHYLQAYYFLHNAGVVPEGDIKIYGVVAEVSMPDGLDLLAVYADHSARYYNYSGRSIIWEAPDHSLDAAIDDILLQAMDTVKQIGPWKEARRPAPSGETARINFLTSHGLHFGEAAQSVLFSDPLARKIMVGVMGVRDALINKTTT